VLHPRTLIEALQRHPHERIVPAVVDANVLISDVWATLRRPAPTALIGQAEARMLRLLITPQVAHEVETRMHRVADERTDEALELWHARYLPVIRIVDPGHPGASHVDAIGDPSIAALVGRVAARDADDAPTAHLALLCAPCLVLTKDADLLDEGFGSPEWLTGVRSSGELADLDKTVWFAMNVSFVAGEELSRRAIAVARAVALSPMAISVAIAAATLVLALRHTWVRSCPGTARARAMAAIDLAVEVADYVAARRAALQDALAPHVVAPTRERSDVARVAARLAIAPSPEPLAQIAAAVPDAHPDRVRELLRSEPAFSVVRGRGWQLGTTGTQTGAAAPAPPRESRFSRAILDVMPDAR